MDFSLILLLFGAGLAGGVVNAIAGGATLITFPAMLSAGLAPVIANASSAVAVTPGHFGAVYADYRKLPRWDKTLGWAIAAVALGGALGAVLLIVTPEHVFTLLVPGFVGTATAIFAFAPLLQRFLRKRFEHGVAFGGRLRAFFLLPAATYGGYFGAGLGVMLLAVLTLTSTQDLRSVNALKNALSAIVSLVSILIFIVEGVVQWPQTLTMLAGAICGGYLGGTLVKILPAAAVRSIVMTVGAIMTIYYASKYWF